MNISVFFFICFRKRTVIISSEATEQIRGSLLIWKGNRIFPLLRKGRLAAALITLLFPAGLNNVTVDYRNEHSLRKRHRIPELN